MSKIRVRFAPSPTGYLHIGGLRTALYNYLFAKKNGGDLILRIEDTDQKRFVPGALEELIKSLEWAGITYDEGVYLESSKLKVPMLTGRQESSKIIRSKNYAGIVEAGESAPYIQSERLEIYQKYAHEMAKSGKAYYCFCEPERLEKVKKGQAEKKQVPMYDRYCLQKVSEEEINKNLKNKCPYTIRLKVPEDETVFFSDIVRDKVEVDAATIDDQVLLKSDGYPTYHLASVVDDHLMEITHVIRGEEWLPSTPKHILIYRALGWKEPEFAHLPLLLNPDRSKLSKRQGDVAVSDYLEKGYLKDAIINFIALLGWNPGEGSTQEIFSMEELIEKFDLEKVHKGGAVFDAAKLEWLNAQYIKKLSLGELREKSFKFFETKEFYKDASPEKRSKEYLTKVLAIEHDRLVKLSEVGEHNKFFFQDPNYPTELLRWKEMADPELKDSLVKSKGALEKIDEKNWTKEYLEKRLLEISEGKRGELLWPLRVALTGEKKSPPPFEVLWVLGKDESIKRLDRAINRL